MCVCTYACVQLCASLLTSYKRENQRIRDRIISKKRHPRITKHNFWLHIGLPKIKPYIWGCCPNTPWTDTWGHAHCTLLQTLSLTPSCPSPDTDPCSRWGHTAEWNGTIPPLPGPDAAQGAVGSFGCQCRNSTSQLKPYRIEKAGEKGRERVWMVKLALKDKYFSGGKASAGKTADSVYTYLHCLGT